MKYSASRTGDASRVDTTRKVVRRSDRVRVTASDRCTNPGAMVWNSEKNSAMSSRNCEPRMPSAIR